MQYRGKYAIFDASLIKTYPLSTRSNRVKLENLVSPERIEEYSIDLPKETQRDITTVAQSVVSNRKLNRPVVLFAGAHLIKNGMGPLVVDLVKRDMITLVGGNGATPIHDFELALIGETSESVPLALGQGQFGMAFEFAYINAALTVGNKYCLGYGESLGRMMCDEGFRNEVLSLVAGSDSPRDFPHAAVSVLVACYEKNIPFTVHAGIGVDVIDQHPSFDGGAKGGCSGRDFLIYANEATKFVEGGSVLNIGSAVQGPEVLLKALSMAANVGKTPRNIVTADFDLRSFDAAQMTDESSEGYYFRDQKSIVTRIPEAFEGKGYYIQGDQKQTVPFLYQQILKLSN